MKKLILIIMAISIIACSKSDEIIEQDVVDTLFEISVFNSDNEDMLDVYFISSSILSQKSESIFFISIVSSICIPSPYS